MCIAPHSREVISERDICVVIPSYNASETLGEVLQSVRTAVPNARIIVVDDGSTDRTGSIGMEAGASVVRHERNAGKGAALRSGFNAALKRGCNLIVTLDADGQHNAARIPDLYRALREQNYDLVAGNRMADAACMPKDRFLSNKISSYIVSRICGQKIPDSQCGYRLIKKEIIESITLSTDRFETESELLIKASRAGFRIGSVSIESRYQGTASSIKRLSDTVRFIKMIIGVVRRRDR